MLRAEKPLSLEFERNQNSSVVTGGSESGWNYAGIKKKQINARDWKWLFPASVRVTDRSISTSTSISVRQLDTIHALLFSGSESHVVKLARFWTHVVQLSLHFIVHVFLVSEVCQGSLRDPERLVDEPTGAD